MRNLTYIGNYPILPFKQYYALTTVPKFNIRDPDSIRQALFDSYLSSFPHARKDLRQLIANDPGIKKLESMFVDITTSILEVEGEEQASKDLTTILTMSAIGPPSDTIASNSRKRRSALQRRYDLVVGGQKLVLLQSITELALVFPVLYESTKLIFTGIATIIPLAFSGIFSVAAIAPMMRVAAGAAQIYFAYSTINDVVQNAKDLVDFLRDHGSFIDVHSINYITQVFQCGLNSLNATLTVGSLSITRPLISTALSVMFEVINRFIKSLQALQKVLEEYPKFDIFHDYAVGEVLDAIKSQLEKTTTDTIKPDSGDSDIAVTYSEHCRGTFDAYKCDCSNLKPGTYEVGLRIFINNPDFFTEKTVLIRNTILNATCTDITDTDNECKIIDPVTTCITSACNNQSELVYVNTSQSINYCQQQVPLIISHYSFKTGGSECTEYIQDDQTPDLKFNHKRQLGVRIFDQNAVGTYNISRCGFYTPSIIYCLQIYPSVPFSGMCGYGCSPDHNRCAPCPCCQFKQATMPG
ncbi:hypothetical protein I4U23_015821 [Adineta vaga]|nr:hypothetical protein I4U23_015821 [Adineta vaga]